MAAFDAPPAPAQNGGVLLGTRHRKGAPFVWKRANKEMADLVPLKRRRRSCSRSGSAWHLASLISASELAALDDVMTSVFVDSALGFTTHKMHPVLQEETHIVFARDQVFASPNRVSIICKLISCVLHCCTK